MNTKEILTQMEAVTEQYLRDLERFDMDQLTYKYGEEDWSLGQMYLHLIRSALFMQLRNVELCWEQSKQMQTANERLAVSAPADDSMTGNHAGSEEETDGSAADKDIVPGKTEAGAGIFALGSFPPVRISVPPSPQYTPPQPESKEQLSTGLRQVVTKMHELEPLLAEISPACREPHPRFGHLNATEWFILVEMHFRHHLRQKERLEALLQE
ncbi:DinB family protein [Brevibacillus ruminantium]|uniref:DinB family protein n=1 Tax=Brevibacillus ruminantium TaxID=2950604 RepID=A0ABY4WHG9_9BACL|nr:DinB family protein [Brevibacillus ruminantium]USG65588.1 DinB family protein [Brevibacillus ruminantium]